MEFFVKPIAVVLLCFAVVQLNAADQEPDALTVCMDRHNVTTDDLRGLREGDMEKNLKCFHHCMANELGYFDEMGKFNADKLNANGRMDEKDMAILMECKDKYDKEDEPCEYTYQMLKCMK